MIAGDACSNTMRRHPAMLRSLLCILPLALLAGCDGDDWQSATYPATGKLTINGQPAAGAVIELQAIGDKPDQRNSRPWAIVQADGSYSLSTYEPGDGAPPGEYAVTLRWPPESDGPSLADRLGGVYANRAGSQWNVTIVEGENDLPEIAIENAKLDRRANTKRPNPGSAGPMMPATR